MADVFISYKRERRPAARHVEQILIRYGYSVWFDVALVRGKDYEAQIEHELTAAKAVIALWCGLSVQSEGVRSEANRAKSDGKLIPLVIEPCKLPLFSTLAQNIDLTAATGSPRDPAFDAVLDDLERMVGRPPMPDLRALRDYEATWRSMGALSLSRFPLEQGVAPEAVIGGGARTIPAPSSASLSEDDRKVARLFKLVALGDAAAQANLGVFYEQGRGGLSKDYSEAARLYMLSADQGNALAQASLGAFYEEGRGGLRKDDREAARLYMLSADQGNALGQAYLGFFYEIGRGGLLEDDREAAQLYKLSADQGNAWGQFSLGCFYQNGLGGLPKDDREAARLYKLSADQGHTDAVDELRLLNGGR